MQKTAEFIQLLKHKGWLDKGFPKLVCKIAGHLAATRHYENKNIEYDRVIENVTIVTLKSGCIIMDLINYRICGIVDQGIFYGEIDKILVIADYHNSKILNVYNAQEEHFSYMLSQLSSELQPTIITTIIPSSARWEKHPPKNPIREPKLIDSIGLVDQRGKFTEYGMPKNTSAHTRDAYLTPLSDGVYSVIECLFHNSNLPRFIRLTQTSAELEELIDALLFILR